MRMARCRTCLTYGEVVTTYIRAFWGFTGFSKHTRVQQNVDNTRNDDTRCGTVDDVDRIYDVFKSLSPVNDILGRRSTELNADYASAYVSFYARAFRLFSSLRAVRRVK